MIGPSQRRARRQSAWGLTAASVLSVAVLVPSHQKVPTELQALADADHAFATAAAEKGVRDASLEYFAEDAVSLAPEIAPAKERLTQEPSLPFSELEVTWEPRLGDVAASDDIGWLTGPSSTVDHKKLDTRPRYSNYLSVWKRQPDGVWRVHIRVEVRLPAPPSFPPELARTALSSRYSGPERKEAATRALEYHDATLNRRIASEAVGRIYAPLLTDGSRLYRNNFMPVIGRGAITRWLNQNTPDVSAAQVSTEASAAGDLGYSYGTFEVKGYRTQTGGYLRVWGRDAAGRWFILADAIEPAPPEGPGLALTGR